MCPCYIKFTQTIAPVLLDVAGVGRLHFGALSPARRALEVRLDVILPHRTHSDLACLKFVISSGPFGLRLAPGGSDWLRLLQEAQIGSDWPQEAQIGSDWAQEAQIGTDWPQETQIGSACF